MTDKGTVAEALQVADTQVGMEYELIDNPYGKWDELPGAAYGGQFLSWVMWSASVPGDWRGKDSQRYTPAAWDRWAKLGRLIQVDSGQPGDIAFYGWDDRGFWTDQAELVTANLGGGQYEVIGACIGSPTGVYRQTRTFGPRGIKGFGRPFYRPEPVAPEESPITPLSDTGLVSGDYIEAPSSEVPSKAFKEAVASSHSVIAAMDVWDYRKHAWVRYRVSSGSVTGNSDSVVSRTFSATVIPVVVDIFREPSISVFATDIYRTFVRLFRGIRYLDGTSELLPLGVFGVEKIDRNRPDREVTISGSDLFSYVVRARFLWPQALSGNLIDLVRTLVSNAIAPGLPWELEFRVNSDVVDRYVPTTIVETDRHTFIKDLLASANLNGRFDPVGRFVISKAATTATPSLMSFDAVTPNSNVISYDESLSKEQLYNAVVVTGGAVTGMVGDVIPAIRAVVADMDPSSPTYFGGPFGQVPYFYTSQYIATNEQAQAVASDTLVRVRRRTREIKMSVLPNPMIDVGSVVQVMLPSLGEPETHIVTGFTLPLTAKDPMTVTTRSLAGVPPEVAAQAANQNIPMSSLFGEPV